MLALGEMRKRHEVLGGYAAAADAATGAILRVDDINLSFGGVKAITGVSFEVNRGEISSIIGPNGAGKSSMLNVISGVLPPASGGITFRGQGPHAHACRTTWRGRASRARSRTSRCSRA